MTELRRLQRLTAVARSCSWPDPFSSDELGRTTGEPSRLERRSDEQVALARSTAWVPAMSRHLRQRPILGGRNLFHICETTEFRRRNARVVPVINVRTWTRPGRECACSAITMPRYEILSARTPWTGPRRRLAPDRQRDRCRVPERPRAGPVPGQAGQTVEEQQREVRPGLRARAGPAKAPAGVRRPGAQPAANTVHIGGDAMVFGGVYGPPFVRRGRRAPGRDVRRLPATSAKPGAVLRRSIDTVRWRRCASRTTLHARQRATSKWRSRRQTLTDKFFMGILVSAVNARARRDRDDRDPARRPGRHRGDAGDDHADQLQLTAALGRPDARRAVRVLRRPTRPVLHHPVPPDGGDERRFHDSRRPSCSRSPRRSPASRCRS